MTGSCPALDSHAPVMTSLAQYLDCQADRISEIGFPAAGHGVISQEFLTVCLTIFVALFGYRLLFNRAGLSGGTLVYSMVRLGIVLALCTSWPAYNTLVVRVVNIGPVELARAILQPLNLTLWDPASLTTQLQADFDQIEMQALQSSMLSPLDASGSVQSTPFNSTDPSQHSSPVTKPQITLMTSTLGGLVGLKFAGAILLALGPLIIALSLFDLFLPLVGAWIKALLGLVLSGVATRIVVGVQMAFLRDIVVARAVATDTPQLDPALAPTAAIFLVLNVLSICLAFFAVSKIRWPKTWNGYGLESRLDDFDRSKPDLERSLSDIPPPRSRTLLTADYVRRASLDETEGRPNSTWTAGPGRSPSDTDRPRALVNQGGLARRRAYVGRTPTSTQRDAKL